MNENLKAIIELNDNRTKAAKLLAQAYEEAQTLLQEDPNETDTLQEIWDALTA